MDYQKTVLDGIAFIAGLLGMPLITWIKSKFGWADNKALLLATIISVVLGVAVSVLSQSITMGTVTLDWLVNSATIVFTTATIFYKVLIGSK